MKQTIQKLARAFPKRTIFTLWKLKRRFLGLAVLCAGALSIDVYAGSYTIETDLDLDGRTERVELNAGRRRTLQIRRDGKRLWQGVPTRWKPWKLMIADIDGDGRREIIVGVFKATRFFPKPHNCLFVYGFSDGKAFPKWLGSSLGRPFEDFLFADIDGAAGDELIALETTLEGRKSAALYQWNGFGFTIEKRVGDWKSAKISKTENGRISVEADGQSISVFEETRPQ